jgi:hypothetical protein
VGPGHRTGADAADAIDAEGVLCALQNHPVTQERWMLFKSHDQVQRVESRHCQLDVPVCTPSVS